MAKMCPMSGCSSTRGMCGHEIMMLGMAVLLLGGAVAHWVLHLF